MQLDAVCATAQAPHHDDAASFNGSGRLWPPLTAAILLPTGLRSHGLPGCVRTSMPPAALSPARQCHRQRCLWLADAIDDTAFGPPMPFIADAGTRCMLGILQRVRKAQESGSGMVGTCSGSRRPQLQRQGKGSGSGRAARSGRKQLTTTLSS